MIAHAQTGTELAHSFVARLNEVILFPFITLLTAVALLVFLWGGFQYVYGAGNETKLATGAKHLLWGVIGLLVMLSAYAILTIAANTFGIDVDQYNRTNNTNTFDTSLNATLPSNGNSYAPITSPTPSQQPGSNSGNQPTDPETRF